MIDMTTIQKARSRTVRGNGRGAETSAGQYRVDCQRKYRFSRGDGGGGFSSHQQIRGGTSGQALLRRVRVCGCRGESRPRQTQTDFRLRPLQRPAPFGRAGKFCRLFRHVRTGRHHHGHESLARRTSDARLAVNISGKYFKIVSYGVSPKRKRSTTTRWKSWRSKANPS